MNSRSPGRKSPTKRTVTSSSPEAASACRNGFGSRLPKNEPACVSRKRSPRVYSSPAKSSKSQPFVIVVTDPRGSSPRVSAAIDSAAATMASAWEATSRATPARVFRLATAAIPCEARCGCSTIESRRSATHFTPVVRFTAAPIRWTDPGGDVVSTTSIPSLRTIEIAFGIAVAFHVTFSSGTSRRRPIVDARRSARSMPERPYCSSAIRRPLGPT